MCRNITTLRGLEPEATPEEIAAEILRLSRRAHSEGGLLALRGSGVGREDAVGVRRRGGPEE